MGKARKTRKFAQVKRLLNPNDARLKENGSKREIELKQKKELAVRRVEQTSRALFFSYNTALGPPYHILIDTNFINASIQNRLDMVKGMMDCLLSKCTLYITDCVMGELEKLGPKYRLALRIAKDPRFKRLPCQHKGTYADDCLVARAEQHRCYIVATCDKDLKRRLRKVAGVPIMYIQAHKYSIERLPDALNAPNF